MAAMTTHRPMQGSRGRWICGRVLPDFVLALNEPAWKGPGGHVTKEDVPRQGSEKGNPAADEHGDPGNDEAADQAGAKEALDRDAAVHVDVSRSLGSQPRSDVGGGAAHLLDSSPARRRR